MVEDRLLRQLLVTWLAPVEAAAAAPAAPHRPEQWAQQLPGLEALPASSLLPPPPASLLPSLQLLPGIYTVKAGSTAAAAAAATAPASGFASCCRLRLGEVACDSAQPCAIDEPRPARSPIEVSCCSLPGGHACTTTPPAVHRAPLENIDI